VRCSGREQTAPKIVGNSNSRDTILNWDALNEDEKIDLSMVSLEFPAEKSKNAKSSARGTSSPK